MNTMNFSPWQIYFLSWCLKSFFAFVEVRNVVNFFCRCCIYIEDVVFEVFTCFVCNLDVDLDVMDLV
jgi:hypothetical protein